MVFVDAKQHWTWMKGGCWRGHWPQTWRGHWPQTWRGHWPQTWRGRGTAQQPGSRTRGRCSSPSQGLGVDLRQQVTARSLTAPFPQTPVNMHSLQSHYTIPTNISQHKQHQSAWTTYCLTTPSPQTLVSINNTSQHEQPTVSLHAPNKHRPTWTIYSLTAPFPHTPVNMNNLQSQCTIPTNTSQH